MQRFLALPRPLVVVLAVVLLWGIGIVDYLTGRDFYMSAIYLVPICWAAWAAGRGAGNLLAVASAVTWLVADSASGYSYSHALIPYWNALMLLAFFVIVVHLLTNLRTAHQVLETTVQERTKALEMLEAEIKERKRLEDAELRAERLAAMGRMAAQVAHEVRNPLTAINVRLHSLKKNLAANSSEQEDAFVIGHEIERLERLVREFLQFATPSEPKLVTVSADSLFGRARSLLEEKLEKSSIQLDLQSVPDLWLRVDPHQIEQVLIDLIQNAAESMEGGGLIRLRARAGQGQLPGSTRPVVMLEVSDTGRGISPEVRKRMFDPFFTTKEQGTGLGLVIASRIVEKHHGALECRSEVNRGTTFTVLLPGLEWEESNEPSI